MATVSKWTPFGVALDITATAATVTRISATQYTVKINVSWETYYSGAQTNYGMTAASGGVTHTISAFNGTKRSSGSGSFTGTYSISGNGAASKTVSVTFRNFNTDNDDSATKAVSFTVSVPAWTSYVIKYNANGGSGAPGNQTKWKDQALTLSSTKPTRTGYTFQGWATSASGGVVYAAGGSYSANAAATLYAVWKANTYSVKYNANGGTGAPGNQTKTYGVTLKLSSTIPTRTNYTFKGWAITSTVTSATYQAGGNYTNNAAVTLYAVWELSYTKPVISDLSADRCDSNSTITDSGTYALVKCNWRSDYDINSITVDYKPASSNTWTSGSTHTITSGTRNGSINTKIGNGAFDTDHTYDIRVTITDNNGSVNSSVTLPGTKYIIDVYAEGKGLAIGKPAEHEGVFEVAFPTRFTGGVNGNLHVKDGTTSFPDLVFKASYQGTGVDFNNYKTSGVYGIYGECDNSPISAGQIGVLIVSAYTTDWLDQEFIAIDGGNGSVTRYERTFYIGTTWSAWKKKEDKGRVYNDTAVISPLLIGSGNYSIKLGVNNNHELVWVYQSGGATNGTKWFAPTTDGGSLLGASSYRWGQIYSNASAISTSDRTQKKDFENLNERYESLFEKLKPQLYKFKDGTSDRKHVGFISQDVEESMKEVGLTDKEFAGFCKDVKQTEKDRDEKTGEVFFQDVYDEDGNLVYNYSLRYEEFIALNTHMIQKQQAEIVALKEEIKALTDLVKELKG